jgi:hypothetical protein
LVRAKTSRRTLAEDILIALVTATILSGCNRSPADAEARQLATSVRTEFLHAWRNYERYAWGHDALRPLSKTPHDWYSESLLMSPVDALDTLILMKLDIDANKTRELIANDLYFDRDIYVKNFEITIRLLGGLLSSYQLAGDKRLLALADDLGKRLLPVFNSPTGLPYVMVNLHSGKVRNPISNPAETGTLLLEFGTLSKLTGNTIYYAKAKRALIETFKRRSSIGLVGSSINVETGEWTDPDSHVSGGIDSYYEYLWKCWLLFGDEECRDMFRVSITAVHKYLADDSGNELWYGRAHMGTGQRTETSYGALEAFLPALLALSGDLERARRLQATSFKMWNLVSSRKFSITKRRAWSRALTIFAPKSWNPLTTFITTLARRNTGKWAGSCSRISFITAEPIPATPRLKTSLRKQSGMRWKALSSQKRLNTSICFLPMPARLTSTKSSSIPRPTRYGARGELSKTRASMAPPALDPRWERE